MRLRRLVLLALPALVLTILCLHSTVIVSIPPVPVSTVARPSDSVESAAQATHERQATSLPPSSQNPSCEPLDARAVRESAATNHAGITFATFANKAQLDFALNWFAHLSALGLERSALMGATDEATERGLARVGARCFPVHSMMGTSEAKWGSVDFAHMGRTKAQLVRSLLELNATLLFADIDVVFLRDPTEYLARQLLAGAALLFHTDGFGSSDSALKASPESLELPSFGITPEMNTGLFLMTPGALGLARAWCVALDADGAFTNWKNDQQALNQLVRRKLKPMAYDAGVLLSAAFDGTLPLGLLPNHLFPSGHVFFIQRQLRTLHATARNTSLEPTACGLIDDCTGIVPFAVHLTFQNCDQAGKRHRMREAGLWRLDSPEYYHPEGGLLTFSMDLGGPELHGRFTSLARPLRPTDEVVGRHFQLINHQLVQLRTALAVAFVLNRTLVLPRFLCGLETVTNFAHSGIRCRGASGCSLQLPYWCPADHVLRMHYWRGVMPQKPKLRIGYREWSVLANAATLGAIRDGNSQSIAYVRTPSLPLARACTNCSEDGYVRTRAKVKVPSGITSEVTLKISKGAAVDKTMLLRATKDVASSEVLHFDSMRDFSITLPSSQQRAFDETIKFLGGGWCCVENKPYGHYWYDLQWDRPHVDRGGRQWTIQNPYAPLTGP